ncbi:MAG: hypothetical protein KJO66_06415, partial [Gammaproteobacteria bacterium]|nr:hypothetical protein [Gammaproteobacteria bacterium]
MGKAANTAPLEDLMVAMDVVDTLRHRQQLVERELDTEGRRERLIARLRDIYRAQGIEVSDQVLADGVRALEEDRFTYKPPEATFAARMARLYVRRDKWLGPILLLLLLLLGLWLSYYLIAVRPAASARSELPDALQKRYQAIIELSTDEAARLQASQYKTDGGQALQDDRFDEARSAIDGMDRLLRQLRLAYTVRVIQRGGEQSGVWRIPDINTQARNYYLIVEAVDARGQVLSLPVTSEETGKTRMVDKWGIRVDQAVFDRIAADKRDDGIIQ